MKKIMFFTFTFICFSFISINAQTEISPEKQKAVRELSALINADNKAEEIAKAMMSQMSSMQGDIIKSILDERTDLTPAERTSMEKALIEDSVTRNKQFQDRFFQKLDYKAMLDEIMMVVYDKYYTLEEINDLTAFYKTPTGQKSLRIMQPLTLETMQLSQEKLVPKVIAVINELREEQRQQIAKKVDELKPRKTKTNNK